MDQFSAYAFVMRLSVETDKAKLGLLCRGEMLYTLEIGSFYLSGTLNTYFIDVNIRRHSIIKNSILVKLSMHFVIDYFE